jgi:hypothetical protein
MDMKKDAKQEHEELVALLDTHPEITASDCSSVSSKPLFTFASIIFSF